MGESGEGSEYQARVSEAGERSEPRREARVAERARAADNATPDNATPDKATPDKASSVMEAAV